jgi:hypothetical protein
MLPTLTTLKMRGRAETFGDLVIAYSVLECEAECSLERVWRRIEEAGENSPFVRWAAKP